MSIVRDTIFFYDSHLIFLFIFYFCFWYDICNNNFFHSIIWLICLKIIVYFLSLCAKSFSKINCELVFVFHIHITSYFKSNGCTTWQNFVIYFVLIKLRTNGLQCRYNAWCLLRAPPVIILILQLDFMPFCASRCPTDVKMSPAFYIFIFMKT